HACNEQRQEDPQPDSGREPDAERDGKQGAGRLATHQLTRARGTGHPSLNQVSMSRQEIEVRAPTRGCPEAIFARENHCASSSSESRRLIAVLVARATKPSINDDGNGQ